MKLAFGTLLTFLLLAPAAHADAQNDHGEGWFGETDDLSITLVGFVFIAGFPLFILLASLAYHALENRRLGRLKTEKARLQRADSRGGW